ncbi:hypothetical protein HMPREF9370_1740 [Neisseria wadsworthii 9715]|uniref:Uncharacterized protein n=1 Tax=Neisseria wadsworthii 9715 TaxID=1030841 RepID=G4CRN0_9NEIS|nr:hypothetical protein HMPREF9370_1740 [Neisseria wadsworthii 9715]
MGRFEVLFGYEVNHACLKTSNAGFCEAKIFRQAWFFISNGLRRRFKAGYFQAKAG